MAIDVSSLEAVDVHAHLMTDPGATSDDEGEVERQYREEAATRWKTSKTTVTPDQIADYYRSRKMACVLFTVDAESGLGRKRVPNEAVVQAARDHPDVIIPFASIDPWKGKMALQEAERLIAEGEIRGFKFHPNIQGFYPNDRIAYPLYEVIAEAGLPALFHTGHSGIGSGLPGGGGIRLKYSQPIHVDDVAVDFPELKLVLAHPSFPWTDEAISIAMHKPQVFIDLSGWSPKYFPPQLVQYANTLLSRQVLFGSDYPMIAPDRWLADFAAAPFRDEVRPLILKENAARVLGLREDGP
jgi:uncharacterized protein